MLAVRASVALILVGATFATARAEDVAVARRHFLEGSAAFARGDYEAAVRAFELGRRESPRPEFDFNIGRAYERMGDAAHAARAYRRYLDQREHAADRPEVEEAMERLRARIGVVRVVGRGPGDRVSVDGEPVADGALGAFDVTSGPHVVRVESAGAPARDLPVVARAGQVITVDAARPPPLVAEVRRRSGWKIGLGVGLGVAAVGAAITVGVVLGTRSDPWAATRGSCMAPCQVVDFR